MRRILSILLVLALIGATTATASDGSKWRDIFSLTLSASFASASVADTCLTIHGITRHGLTEVNPFLGNLAAKHRWAALWAIQGVGVGLALIGCNALIRSDETIGRVAGWTLLIALNVFRWVVVMKNIQTIRGHA